MKTIHSKEKQDQMPFSLAAQHLAYDKCSGLLTRLTGPMAGEVAGGVNQRGYVAVNICGRIYAAHRVAWLLHYGRWPDGDLDHINRVKTDNRIENLRSVSTYENNMNRDVIARRYGFDKTKGLWRVFIKAHGKCRHLGYFATEAGAARRAAELGR